MGSASSTYRPKCIYLDIDGRIQKVLLLFFTQRCLGVSADPAAHPAGSASLAEGKGGDPALLLLPTRLFVRRGRGGWHRGGLGDASAVSLPALPAGGDARFRSRACRVYKV